MSDFVFTLNGKATIVQGSSERFLLNVLRDDLHLTGAKRGCESSDCGCCTVLVDGRPAKSCSVRMKDLAGKQVLTIEGLSRDGQVHVVQKAFAETGAVQCGFCTPGMILRAKSLLDANPTPTREQIIAWMQPNLCRCGGYQKIIEAIQYASTLWDRQWFEASEVAPSRIDIMAKVQGTAQFTADRIATSAEPMLAARLVRSPHHHAKIQRIDAVAALAVPGVIAVFTAEDIPGSNALGKIVPDQPVLAAHKVRWQGEPVAMVVADTDAGARDGARQVRVEYEVLPHVLDMEKAMQDEIAVHEGGSNILRRQGLVRGDTAAAFLDAAVIVENEYRLPMQEHAYLECEAGFGYWEDGKVVICSPNQAPYATKHDLVKMLACPPEKVRIIHQTCGGSFGGKGELSVEGVLALAVHKLRRPVSMIYGREESLTTTPKSHPFIIRYKTGADLSGKITAVEATLVAETGAYALTGPAVLKRAATQAYGPYDIPNIKIDGYLVYTNTIPTGALRGFGVPQVTFAVESQLDELARRLNLDPIELRRKNILREGSRAATGEALDTNVKGLERSLEQAGEIYRRERKIVDGKNRNASGSKFGLGVASMWFGIGRTGNRDFVRIDVEISPTGGVSVFTGLTDLGQGSNGLVAQIIAQELYVPPAAVSVIAADTDLSPESTDTSASKVTYITLNAMLKALALLKEELFAGAAAQLGVPAAELQFCPEGVCSATGPGRSITLAGILRGRSLRCSGSYETRATLLDAVTGQGIAHQSYEYATHISEVEVIGATGEVRVINTWSIHDVGRVLNAQNLAAQIEGGVLMGLGRVLRENYIHGQTRSFKQYLIPRFADIPFMYHEFIEEPDPYGPFGARGASEGSSAVVLPSIANGICDATGVRLTALPVNTEETKYQGINR